MAYKIDTDACVGCGTCASTCPVADECVECGACAANCPVGAISQE